MRSVDKDRRAPGEEGRRFATTTPMSITPVGSIQPFGRVSTIRCYLERRSTKRLHDSCARH